MSFMYMQYTISAQLKFISMFSLITYVEIDKINVTPLIHINLCRSKASQFQAGGCNIHPLHPIL
jgi:hypothetical protein